MGLHSNTKQSIAVKENINLLSSIHNQMGIKKEPVQQVMNQFARPIPLKVQPATTSHSKPTNQLELNKLTPNSVS